MWTTLKLWLENRYLKILNSISFFPALIVFLFLILAIFMFGFDFSSQGKHFKSQASWLNIKDATTARSIISSITAGVISLAVFSFSMVMIVLNQAASQMSNRVLDKLIGNRFQQLVLGIYIGTIVYAFFLLSTIRDIDSGLYIPSLSIYFLILLTVFDLFLFIYFLHYITQSVKYEVIIRKIKVSTQEAMGDICTWTEHASSSIMVESGHIILAQSSGIHEGFDKKSLLRFCEKHDCLIYIIPTPGTFILEGMPIAKVSEKLENDLRKDIALEVFLHESESIEDNYFYGFRQLTEIALKALSPGINDPGTAIISLRSLFELYAFRIKNFPNNTIVNKKGQARIILEELTFDKIFADTILPIWNYGKNDRMIRQELLLLLPQLLANASNSLAEKLLGKVKQMVKQEEFDF